jgi:hypothetical protein
MDFQLDLYLVEESVQYGICYAVWKHLLPYASGFPATSGCVEGVELVRRDGIRASALEEVHTVDGRIGCGLASRS